MKIMVINPNSSVDITNHIRKAIEMIKRQETELVVTCPNKGPITIESAYDETLAAFYCMDLVKKANIEKFDAVVVACFSDPGLIAMKEISDILEVIDAICKFKKFDKKEIDKMQKQKAEKRGKFGNKIILDEIKD